LRLLRGEEATRDERATVLHRATSSDSSALTKIVQDRIRNIRCGGSNPLLPQELLRVVFDAELLRNRTDLLDILTKNRIATLPMRVHLVKNHARDRTHFVSRVRHGNAVADALKQPLNRSESVNLIDGDERIVTLTTLADRTNRDRIHDVREVDADGVEECSQHLIVVKIREPVDGQLVVVVVAHVVAHVVAL